MREICEFHVVLPGIEAVSLESTRHFPRHSHDQFGIGVISSGVHRSWSSIGWVNAVCGDIIMVNPGEMHDGSSPDGQARSWNMLFLDPKVPCETFIDEEWHLTVDLKPAVRDRVQSTRFGKLFAALTDPHPDALYIEQSLMMTLAYAFRHHGSQRPVRLPASPSVAKVVKLIDCEPEKPRSLREMANIAGVSPFHFLRGFARTTGATPHAYILQRRIRLARRLLAMGIETAQVGVEAGFADQSHMTRAFVRQLGVTPSRYRQAVYAPKGRAISFKTARSRLSIIGL